MASIIANHLEKFNEDIKQLSESMEEMRVIYIEVFKELDSLTGMWEGSANQVFRNQFHEDAQNMENLYIYLQKYLESLQEDYNRYYRCEVEIQDLIQQIQI